MSTKRERYELAARAAGLSITWKTGNCKGGPFEAAFIGDKPWRPEDDDGDALRLAVTLGLSVCVINDMGFTGVYIPQEYRGGKYDVVAHHLENPHAHPLDSDALAATRRAIFLAAIDIGKAML